MLRKSSGDLRHDTNQVVFPGGPQIRQTYLFTICNTICSSTCIYQIENSSTIGNKTSTIFSSINPWMHFLQQVSITFMMDVQGDI